MTSLNQIFVLGIIYTAFLYLLIDDARKHVKLMTLAFFLLVLSTPLWISKMSVDGDWFGPIKTVSVLVPITILFLALWYKFEKSILSFVKRKWVLGFLYLVLIANISEAMLKDFQNAYYLNALAAVLLIITIPLSAFTFKKVKAEYEFDVYLPFAWAVLYTTWNLVYLLGYHPAYVGISVPLLLAPLLYCLFTRKPQLWLFGRAVTLAFNLSLRGIDDVLTPLMNTENLGNPWKINFLGGINLILMIVYLAWWVYHTRAMHHQHKLSFKH